MGGAAAASGPDFAKGIGLDSIPASGILAGRVGDEPVLLSRLDGELFAVGGACTHYGAALASGVVEGETIRCPLHHACFSLRTGAALRAPAFDDLDRWQVDVEGASAFVRRKQSASAPRPVATVSADVRSVLLVGGGGGAFACASELRRLGYQGDLTMLSADPDPPCDRPNLSKDYLAGTAPEDWIPLRGPDHYRDAAIDLRLGTEIVAIDPVARFATSRAGEAFSYDRLLIATGAEPVRLGAPGLDRTNVHTLRSLADARAIAGLAEPGAKAAIIGSGFVGLEAAAALRARGVDVTIVSADSVPFERQFGRELGLVLQALHRKNGVRFRMGGRVAGYNGTALELDDGTSLEADFVIIGVGVRPRTALAPPGVAVEDGISVDRYLATAIPDIYAAGDVAAYPDPLSGRPTRIEHWVTALRQGQVAARNMLGMAVPFTAIPFFWTEQYGVALRYVGNGRHWDEVRIEGDPERFDFIARYYEEGRHCASLAAGRDQALLEDELGLERLAGASELPAGTFAPRCHPS